MVFKSHTVIHNSRAHRISSVAEEQQDRQGSDEAEEHSEINMASLLCLLRQIALAWTSRLS